MKRQDLKQNAGYIVAHRSSPLKGWVTVYRAEDQGLWIDDGGRYAVICEQHGGLIQTNSLRDARLICRLGSREFCEECQNEKGETR